MGVNADIATGLSNAAVEPRKAVDEAGSTMSRSSASEFEHVFLPHLDAAYNLARLLLRDIQDADDVVQESYLRAMRGFAGFRGEASRAWLLKIVRNTCFTWLRDNRARSVWTELDEEVHSGESTTPELQSVRNEEARAVTHCIEQLPLEFREAIILREMEQMSYQEIAEIAGVPQGTVMSRLSRARARLSQCLKYRLGEPDTNDLKTGRRSRNDVR